MMMSMVRKDPSVVGRMCSHVVNDIATTCRLGLGFAATVVEGPTIPEMFDG